MTTILHLVALGGVTLGLLVFLVMAGIASVIEVGPAPAAGRSIVSDVAVDRAPAGEQPGEPPHRSAA